MSLGRLVQILTAVLAISVLACCSFPDKSGTPSDIGRSGKAKNDTPAPPWFGGYLDVTLEFPTSLSAQSGSAPDVTLLAFVTSGRTRPCEPSWGGSYSFAEAEGKLGLDQKIKQLKDSGKGIAVSFGGQLGSDLAVTCPDEKSLLDAYNAVVARYDPQVLDLDVEGAGASDPVVAQRRAQAIAQLQTQTLHGEPPRIWLTLPVSRSGLTPAAALSVRSMLEAGVDIAGVNLMTMNFGPLAPGVSMLEASMAAVDRTYQALIELYEQSGLQEERGNLWNRIGITPMIGTNDVQNNVFTLEDAQGLNDYALDKGVGRVSMWSLNRDVSCASPASEASHSCSGVDQQPGEFAQLLRASLGKQQG
ncbi:chitinase [Pseudarthrobacter enclensis]|uniref:chitinase n=1 Tax=Pseudarthrobacter enclensis TaxID=993070 RepID=UPI003424E726